MPLPSTNLTTHFDASDSDHLWTTYTAGSPFHSGTPSDGSAIQVWDDDDGKDLSFIFGSSGDEPAWRSSTPLMILPCVDFSGSDRLNLYNNAKTGDGSFFNLFSSTVGVLFISFLVESVSSNAAAAYDNETLIGESTGYYGVFVRNSSGTYYVLTFLWDGAEKTLQLGPISLDTSYVLVYWFTGNTQFAELYSTAGLVDSDSQAISGGPTVLGLQPRLGLGVSQFFNGRLGEVASYNAHDATDRATATSYFRDKWVPTPQEPAYRLRRFY